MKKSIIISTIAAATLIGVSGFILTTIGKPNMKDHDMNTQPITGIKTTNQSNSAMVATDKVTIKDFAFGPARISVKKGTKVTWTNQDSAHHDITADQASSDFVDGPLLAKGESYSYTFEKTGTYTYHCSPHPYMKASVVVTE